MQTTVSQAKKNRWLPGLLCDGGFRPSVHLISRLAAVALTSAIFVAAVPVQAELPEPRLYWIYPPGGQQGTKVDISIAGADMDEPDRLVFSHPGITAVPKIAPPRSFEKEPRVLSNQFVVTIAADVPPGSYEARVHGRYGLSTPRNFEVGDLPEVVEPEEEANKAIDRKLPLTVNSVTNARGNRDGFDTFEFTAKAGERVILRCATRSIDSRMSAVLEVLSAEGNQLAFSRATYRREPMIDFKAPADGTYRLKVYDTTYRGGEQFFYRLELSTRPYIDFLFPPSGMPATSGRFMIFGHNLPGGSPVQGVPYAEPGLEQLAVDIALPAEATSLCLSPSSTLKEPVEAEVEGYVYRLPSPSGPSNPAFVSFARAPVAIEQEPNDDLRKPQVLSLPCEVAGQFYPHRDADWFSFHAKKGETYSIEVFSERLTLPTDPAVLVQHIGVDADGREKVRVVVDQDDAPIRFANPPFDAPSHDVAFQFTADADGTHRILVRDLYAGSNAHPRHVYRMKIGPPQPDFRLVATSRVLIEASSLWERVLAGTPTLLKGGAQPILVQAYRCDGFDGPITLSIEGLPPGVTCSPVTIAQGQRHASLIVVASQDAAPWSGPIKIVGTAKLNGQDVRHEALASAVMWDKFTNVEMTFARVLRDATLSVTAEVTPVRMSLVEDKVWETARAGKIVVPIKIERHVEIKGNPKLDVRGLPPEIKLAPVTLDAQTTDAKFEITVDPKAAPGQYPFFFVLQARIPYERNPEAARRAEAQRQAFAVVVTQLSEAAKTAEAAKVDAEKKVAELAAAGDKPELADARKAAEEAKTKTAEATKVAMEILNAALEEQKLVDKQAKDQAESAKLKDIDAFAASPSMTINVAEAPIKLVVTPAPAAIKYGTQAEIGITFERLFGYAGPVVVEVEPPQGVAGVSIDRIEIAPDQSAGKLIAKVADKATVGVHVFKLHVKLNFNGQNLQVDRAVEVKVEANP